MSLARHIVHLLGGDRSGNSGLVAGLGHTAGDRSISVKDHPSNPDDVLAHSFGRDDSLTFKRELRARGLLPPLRACSTGQQRPAAWQARPKPAVSRSEDQLRRQEFARRINGETLPICDDTAAAAYLSTARGLPGPWPASLRYHPRCPRGKGERPVIVLADRGGENGARKAAEIRAAEGREVRIALPPEGFKDFNDIVRGK